MYAAKLHSSRLQGPTERDLRSLKHTLRYIKGTTHYKLFIGRGLADYLPTYNGFVTFPQNNIPWIYVATLIQTGLEDKTTRRSTSGWLCSLLGTPLSYASRTQATVTLSSAEAELMALSSGMAEALHLQQLIEELQTGMGTTTFSFNNKKCITLYTDSTSATSLASKLGVNRRSRHISLRYLWIQDLRQAGEVDIRRVATHENPADIYTKLLPAKPWKSIYLKMGFYHYSTERGKKSACTTSKAKRRTTRTRTTKAMTMVTTRFFSKNH